MIAVGEIIAERYEVLAELGQGGTAAVHLAVARGPGGFNKLVVLKTPIAEGDAPPSSRPFLREARVAARLDHPHVVQTFEVLEVRGWPIIVMEYLQGQPLSRVIEAAGSDSYGFPLGHELRVLVDVLRGLHHAHELVDFDGTPLKIVHRDVSPQNVFVTYDGQVKLLDFGLVQLARLELDGSPVHGKLRYMSPEHVLGQPVDRRTDVFGVGIMLWEALTGERFWGGKTERQIRTELLSGDMPSPRALRPDVPSVVESVCMEALAHDPADRFATAFEFEEALAKSLEGWCTLAEPRELGARLQDLFADDRERTELAIQAQLASGALLHVAGNTEPALEGQPREGPPRDAVTGDTGPRAWGRGRLLVLGVAVLFLLSLLVGAASLTRATIAPPSDPVAQPTPRAQPAPTAAQDLMLNHASPAPAATGRGIGRRSVKPDPPPVEPVKTPPSASAAPSDIPAASSAPVEDRCASPFYYDDRGIKRFRRDCLR